MYKSIVATIAVLGLLGSEVSPAIAGVEAEYSGAEAEVADYSRIRRIALKEHEEAEKREIRELVEDVAQTPRTHEELAARQGSHSAYSIIESPQGEEEEDEEEAYGDSTRIAPQITNQNTINVGIPADYAGVKSGETLAYAPTGSAATVAGGAEAAPTDADLRTAIIPMAGVSGYHGRWNDHISQRYGFGLILEQPLSRTFSLEAEGEYSRSYISYSSYGHHFNRYAVGGNGKLYLTRGTFSPYVGGGIMGVLYDDMTYGPLHPAPYSRWVGSGQIMAGGDVKLNDTLSLGVRGAYLRPMFNKPVTSHNGAVSFPLYEEAAAINSSYYKLMGALRVAL